MLLYAWPGQPVLRMAAFSRLLPAFGSGLGTTLIGSARVDRFCTTVHEPVISTAFLLDDVAASLMIGSGSVEVPYAPTVTGALDVPVQPTSSGPVQVQPR